MKAKYVRFFHHVLGSRSLFISKLLGIYIFSAAQVLGVQIAVWCYHNDVITKHTFCNTWQEIHQC